jgi:RNA polymerase sigma-70 factor, ECF subfamily
VPPSDHNEAMVQALTASQGRLYAYILTLLPHAEAARDVLQETNLVLWRKAAEAPEGSAFIGWSFRVAQLQVMSHLRDRARARRRFDDQLLAAMDAEAQRAANTADDRMVALEFCLQKLDPASRDLIVKRYGSTASVDETARALGKTANAVSRSLFRIRMALLRCIETRLAHES